ncbi:MAG: NUDIX hydrolase [Armatimonadetes bacterium]|nr:NUDIX hydrolase [Armatimonadota bacterium]
MATTRHRRHAARVLSTDSVFRGHVIQVRRDRVVMPNGAEATREVVEYPPSVGIVAVPERGRVLLIRQYRYTVDEYLWEIPAGKTDPGERPHSAARRELREETGYTAGRFELLAHCYTSPGVLTERMRLYLATGLRHAPLVPDSDECIQVRVLPVQRALHMIGTGRIRDGKTVLGLILLARTRGEWVID